MSMYCLVLWMTGHKSTSSIVLESDLKVGDDRMMEAKWGKQFYPIRIIRKSRKHNHTYESLSDWKLTNHVQC